MFSYGKAIGLAAIYAAKNMTRGASKTNYTGQSKKKALFDNSKIQVFGR